MTRSAGSNYPSRQQPFACAWHVNPVLAAFDFGGRRPARLAELVLAAATLLLVGCTSPLLKVITVAVDSPSFSPGGGVFGADQTVSMSCTTAHAVIHCTADGNGAPPGNATDPEFVAGCAGGSPGGLVGQPHSPGQPGLAVIYVH